jgi:hypothetical protein
MRDGSLQKGNNFLMATGSTGPVDAPPFAHYAMWWLDDDWCVIARECAEPGGGVGIPAISVQFDNWKPSKRVKPQQPVLDIPLGKFDRELEPA